MAYPKKIKSLSSSFALVLTLGFLGCTPQLKDDQALVRINDIVIKVRDYRLAVENLKPEETAWTRRDEYMVRNALLKSLIRRAVLLSEAKRKNILITDAEIEKATSDYKSSYKAGTFDQALLSDRINPEDWNEKIKEDLIIKKLAENIGFVPTKPTLRDMLLFYEKNSQNYKVPESVDLQQIIVEDQKTANEITTKLKSQPLTLPDLAKEYSSAWSERNKEITRLYKGSVPDELSQILFSSSVGKLQGPISFGDSFIFFKIIRKNPSLNKDFETVKIEIEKQLMKEQELLFIENLQDTLLRAATIDYNRQLISAL